MDTEQTASIEKKKKAAYEDDGHVENIGLTSSGFGTGLDTEIVQDVREDGLGVHHSVSGKRYYVCCKR